MTQENEVTTADAEIEETKAWIRAARQARRADEARKFNQMMLASLVELLGQVSVTREGDNLVMGLVFPAGAVVPDYRANARPDILDLVSQVRVELVRLGFEESSEQCGGSENRSLLKFRLGGLCSLDQITKLGDCNAGTVHLTSPS
jgi:hypothetical protein